MEIEKDPLNFRYQQWGSLNIDGHAFGKSKNAFTIFVDLTEAQVVSIYFLQNIQCVTNSKKCLLCRI